MNNHEGGPPTDNAPIQSKMDYFNNMLGINLQNDCGCHGEDLRKLVQNQIDAGRGRRIRGSGVNPGILNPTTSANIDND